MSSVEPKTWKLPQAPCLRHSTFCFLSIPRTVSSGLEHPVQIYICVGRIYSSPFPSPFRVCVMWGGGIVLAASSFLSASMRSKRIELTHSPASTVRSCRSPSRSGRPNCRSGNGEAYGLCVRGPDRRLDATVLVWGTPSGASPDGMQSRDGEESGERDLERVWLPTGFPH